jgi:hypothetical protein
MPTVDKAPKIVKEEFRWLLELKDGQRVWAALTPSGFTTDHSFTAAELDTVKALVLDKFALSVAGFLNAMREAKAVVEATANKTEQFKETSHELDGQEGQPTG